MRIDRTWLKSNQGNGFILTFLFVGMLVYLELSPWSHVELRDGFSLGFLPRVSTILLLFFSVLMILDGHRKALLSSAEAITFGSLTNTAIMTAACYIFFQLICVVGFIIVAPFVLTIAIYLFGIKSWRTCIISGVVIGVVIYVVFRLLGIALPAGILAMD